MQEIYREIFDVVINIAIALIGTAFSVVIIPWIKDTIIPWLKEKRLYTICVRFVTAVEKMAESGAINKSDKKQLVVNLLTQKGYKITPEVNAYIESAVKELDNAFIAIADLVAEEVAEE